MNSIDDEYKYQTNSIKYTLYEKSKIEVENELKKLFKKNLEDIINELNTKIYDFYKNAIKILRVALLKII